MSLQTLTRGRRLLAGATAATLTAGLFAFAPASAQAAESAAVPSVTVSKVTFAPDESATVTVTGTGFDPAAATGTRPPFLGQPGGAYVILGYFADDWRPSANAPSSDRKVVTQQWALPAAQITDDLIAGGAFELQADGSFQTTIDVEKSQLDEVRAENPTLDGNFGIYTYAGSGAKVASYETYTPISFVPATPVATNVSTKYARGGTVTVTAPVPGTVTVAGLGSKTATAANQKLGFAVPKRTTAGTKRYAVSFVPADASLTAPAATTATVKIAKRAAYKPKLKVNKKPTRKAKGKAMVRVKHVAGGAHTTGKVRLKLTKGKKNRFVNVNLVKGKRTVKLPKLAKGKWTVRAAYFGNANYTKRKYVKVGAFKVTK